MRRHALAAALALLLSPTAFAQHAGHAPQQQVEAPAAEATDAEEAADPPAGHHMPAQASDESTDTEASEVDHAAMGHAMLGHDTSAQ